jgi:hypothetical protein
MSDSKRVGPLAYHALRAVEDMIGRVSISPTQPLAYYQKRWGRVTLYNTPWNPSGFSLKIVYYGDPRVLLVIASAIAHRHSVNISDVGKLIDDGNVLEITPKVVG